jgi:hypothetical protein
MKNRVNRQKGGVEDQEEEKKGAESLMSPYQEKVLKVN